MSAETIRGNDMSFTPILIPQDFAGKGALSLPNQPVMPAEDLKAAFDAPSRQVCAPAFNRLITELEATTGATSLGATAPTGRGSATTVQGVINKISDDLGTLESSIGPAIANAHTHSNKDVLDAISENPSTHEFLYNGSSVGKTEYDQLNNLPQVNGVTLSGNKTTSDLGIIIPDELSDLADDSSHRTVSDTEKTAWNGKTTVSYTQTYTQAGQKIGEITIDGVTTDLKAPTGGGGGGGGAVDSVNGQTGTVVLNASDVGALPSSTTIPSKVSDLTNDSGFQTSSDVSTAISTAIGALDGTVSGSAGAGKTLTAFSETDGKVSATFGDISITKSQISDFPTIPTVNDGQLSITVNGTATTFTANQSSNASVSITTDGWTSTALVQSNNTVTFTGLDDSYAYDLYCQNKLIGVSAMTKTGSGLATQLVFTVTGASTGDVCKLRIVK